MRSLCRVRTARPVHVGQQPTLVLVQRLQSTSTPPTPPPSHPPKPRGVRFDLEEGLSGDLKGIGVYAGSISGFMKSPEEKKATQGFGGGGVESGRLPCEDVGTSAALQAAQAEYMASVAKTGKLPSPRRSLDAQFTARSTAHGDHSHAHGASHGHAHGEKTSAAPASPPPTRPAATQGATAAAAAAAASAGAAASSRGPSSLPRRASPAALNAAPRRPPASLNAGDPAKSSSKPASSKAEAATSSAPSAKADDKASKNKSSSSSNSSRISADGPQVLRNKEASDYYKSLPQNELTKEEMWQRINAAQADRAEAEADATAIASLDVDYLKMEEEMRDFDVFHYRIGELAYPDADMRRNYYALWNLAMSLNKARWGMLEVHSQRGMKTTGAGMKLIFWKESVNAIMEKRRMNAGQFTDSHPVLRPFAAAVEQNPHMTKAFVRGFTDARLKVIQQPGNVQQLFDHFDKFYGYFFNSLLEVTHVKDEAAEHLMTHIGRATGLTNHCVMFWKKYARLGFTMLPSDICADNHVNLALLKNIPLASQDRAVRKVLFDVMCIVKDEMVHAQKIAKDVPPKAWPIVMECLYANYYLGFLQRREFNVSAMFADHNIENAGFAWYRLKKRWEWEKYQSIERLLDESAPIPLLGTSYAHRGSKYKVASGIGKEPAKL